MRTSSVLLVMLALLVASPGLNATELEEGIQIVARGGSAEPPRAQSALERVAGLSIENATLQEALDRLTVTSGVAIAYSPTTLPRGRRVSCACANVSVGDAVRTLLEGTTLEFTVVANQLVVRPRSSPASATPVFASASPSSERPVGVVTGRITDATSGQPLASVQVFISAQSIGALSQVNGRYLLQNVPAGNHTLRAERIGYSAATMQITVADGSTLVQDIRLTEEVLQLDALVVTGTAGGTQRRAVGNVVDQIDAAALVQVAPITSMEQLLGSKVPGLVSVTSSGTVGADASMIRLRGASSASLAGNPLVYVDGVRINSDLEGGRDNGVSRLNDINPADIQSVEIIKGPAAATLYGTEAANGVIQIITKRGRTGAPAFDISSEWGSSWLWDPSSTVPVNYAVSRTTGQLLSMHLPTAEEERFGKPFFQNGPIRRNSISVSGGTELIRYFASYNRSYLEGIVDWNWEKANSGRASIGVTASESLDMDVNMSFSSRETRFPGGWWANMSRGTPLTAADYGGAESPLRGWDALPEELRDGSEELADVSRSSINLTVSAQPFSWLQARAVAGTDRTDAISTDVTYRREADSPFGEDLGSRNVDNSDVRMNSFDVSGTATFAVTSRLKSVTSVGLQYNKRQNWSYGASGEEFASPILTTVGAAARTTGSESFSENVSAGFYVQEQVDLNNRVFLTGAVRMDDNSAFGTEFDAAVYPKLSGTWVLHEEPFFNLDFVSALRLRGAWGAAGRQPDLFDAARVYQAVTGPGDQPILTPQGFGNPNLGPERGEELEVGLDAGFLEDRVQLEFTHYWRKTTDAIVARDLAPGIGFPGSQLANIGQISSWGTETQLDVDVLNAESLAWTLSFGFATMHNRIDDLGGVERIPVRRGRQHIKGYPLAAVHNIKIVSADFVTGTSGRVTNIMCDGGTGPDGRQEGGAPVPCTGAPLLYQGPGEPTWNVNVSSNMTLLSNVQLYANIDARGGNIQHHDGIAARHTSWANSLATSLKTDPIFVAYTQVDRARLADYNAGFARLRELGLRLALPSSMAARVGASALAVNFSMRNLPYLWRAESHTPIGNEPVPSPEVVITGEDPFFGESHSSQPPTTQASFTIRASF